MEEGGAKTRKFSVFRSRTLARKHARTRSRNKNVSQKPRSALRRNCSYSAPRLRYSTGTFRPSAFIPSQINGCRLIAKFHSDFYLDAMLLIAMESRRIIKFEGERVHVRR